MYTHTQCTVYVHMCIKHTRTLYDVQTYTHAYTHAHTYIYIYIYIYIFA